MEKDFKSITDFSKDSFLLFLQDFFSNHPTWPYDVDENKTKIQICDDFTINLEVSNFRPSVTVTRGSVKFVNAVLGQQGGFDFKTGKRSYTDLLSCDIILKCISRNGLEAEKIGTSVFSAVHMSRDEIQKTYRIMRVSSVDLGMEQPYKKDSEYDLVMVPIRISFLKQWSWATIPIAPKMRELEIRTHAGN